MSTVTFFTNPKTRPSLNESLYSLLPDEVEFFKIQTGIHDDAELKAHILAVQTKAYEIYGYPCIRRFGFTKLKISLFSVYSHVLKLGREREGAILLDMACCFGNDIRKAVADGYPIQNVIASDLREGFWNLGHELFKSTPESFPVKFIAGDVFDSALIAHRNPFYQLPETSVPSLHSLNSLNPLQGHISVIHASAFFHLFNEEQQFEAARALASLLSPLPGSVIFGSHGGLPEKGFRPPIRPEVQRRMFCHSADSWKELWDGGIFKKGTVKVDAQILQVARDDTDVLPDTKFYLLNWCVMRL